VKVTEEWRSSPSFPLYSVSNLGRVRRGRKLLARFFYRRHYCVAVQKPRRQAVPVSTLVAEAFCGLANPAARRTSVRIIHFNDDRSDNRAANLIIVPRRWCSELDLRRANQLLEDGVGPKLREKLTGVKASRLQRYRKREGCAARRRGDTPKQRMIRELEAWRELLGASRRKADGAGGIMGGDDGPWGSRARHST